MVLPAPAPDDAPDPRGRRSDSWIHAVRRELGLVRAGILILVDHAHPARLGELVRALSPTLPELEVHTDILCCLTAPEGSTIVLAPRASDADWLNVQRPVFARRALRVILWCDTETTLALRRDAVDFYDWISHRHECPPGVAAHGVAGIRGALAARARGIAWQGGDLDACFHAALPGRDLWRVSAGQPYEDLVGAVRRAGPRWVAWTGVDRPILLRRARWALAEAGRRTRTVLVEPGVPAPGWWPAHGRWMPLAEARERLERAGAAAPGRMAAMTGLEPEAVEIAAELLVRGTEERAIEAALRGATDPGAALSGLGAGLGFAGDPPVLRASGGWGLVEPADDFGAEEMLRRRGARDWKALAGMAIAAEDGEVARGWAERGLARSATAEMLMLAGDAAVAAEDYDGAGPYFERAVESALQTGDVSILSRGRASLGLVRTWQGRIEEAEALAREALLAVEGDTAEAAADRANALYHLGKVLASAGRGAAAEGVLKEAVRAAEQLYGEEDDNRALAYQALGEVLGDRGAFAEAERRLNRARSIYGRHRHGAHQSYVEATVTLGSLLANQGRYEEAEHLLRDALHFDAATTRAPMTRAYALRFLGDALNRRGRPDEAAHLLREAIEILRERLDPEHAVVGECLAVLADTQLTRGDYATAEATARQALAILEHALGADHPRLCLPLQTLAQAIASLGRQLEAVPLADRALAIARAVYDETHRKVVILLATCASIQSRAKDPRAAVTAREAFDGARALRSRGDPVGPEIAAKLIPIGLASWLKSDYTAFQGGDVEAVDRVASLVDAADEMGFERPALLARVPLVGMLASLGRTAEAVTEARVALALASKSGDEDAVLGLQRFLHDVSEVHGTASGRAAEESQSSEIAADEGTGTPHVAGALPVHGSEAPPPARPAR